MGLLHDSNFLLHALSNKISKIPWTNFRDNLFLPNNRKRPSLQAAFYCIYEKTIEQIRFVTLATCVYLTFV